MSRQADVGRESPSEEPLLPGEFPALSGSMVHVWRVALDVPAETARRLVELLAPEEREQAGRLRTDELRRGFIVRRARLRELLAAYLKADPASLGFSRGAYGKPSLAGPWCDGRLRFSASHSADLALVAVSLDRVLGIDIERIRPLPDFEDLCRNYFARSENEALRLLPASERLMAFFRGWVRKEAMLKALGTGLSLGLDQVVVSLDDEMARVVTIQGSCQAAAAWRLEDLRLAPNYAAALARPTGDCRLACFRIGERIGR